MPFRRKRSKSRNSAPPKKRIRRDPAEARAHILAAARRVFAAKGPDAAGLKDVALEAGVSHGLVTHYFGRYDALVEAALEDLTQTVVRQVLTRIANMEEPPQPRDMVNLYFDVVMQPEHGRLFGWAMLSGRLMESDFFARRVQGPRLVAEAIEARVRKTFPEVTPKRSEIDWMLVVVMSVGFGLGIGEGLLWEALGRRFDAEEQEAFRAWFGDLVASRLPHVRGDGADAHASA